MGGLSSDIQRAIDSSDSSTKFENFKKCCNKETPFFLLRISIGIVIITLACIFLYYSANSFIFHDLPHINDTYFEVKSNWHTKILMYVDKLLICITIVYVGELIIFGSLRYLKEIARENRTTYFFQFDKPLSNMIIITIAISFLKKVLEDGTSSFDIFISGFGIALVIVALGAWSFLEQRRN